MEQAKADGQPEGAGQEENQALANELFAKLLSGEKITETIETNRGIFKIRYPLGRDYIEIDRRKAIMRGGVPSEQFDRTAESNFEAYASLDVLVEEKPSWCKFDSFVDCPDMKIVKELYRGYLHFCQEVQGLLDLADDGNSLTKSPVPTKTEAVGRGLFSGFTVGNRKHK